MQELLRAYCINAKQKIAHFRGPPCIDVYGAS